MWSKACLQPEGTFSFPCHFFKFFFITRPPASQRSDYSINRLTTAARDVSHHLRCVRYWPTLGKQTAEKKGRVVGLLSADGRSQTLRQINPPSSVSQVTKGFFARQWPLCSLSRSFSFPPSSGLLFTTSPPPFLSVPITRSLETMSHMHNWTRTLALPFLPSCPTQTHARREQLTRHKGSQTKYTQRDSRCCKSEAEGFFFGLVWPGVLSAMTPPAPSFSLLVLLCLSLYFQLSIKRSRHLIATHFCRRRRTEVSVVKCKGKKEKEKKKNNNSELVQ